VGCDVPEDAIDELLDDSAAVDALLLQALLVEEDDLVLFAQIASHAGLVGVLELVPPAHCDDEVLVHLLLQKQGPVVVFLVLFYELFQLPHSRLEGKDEGKLSQQHLYSSSAFAEKETLEGSTELVINKILGIYLACSQTFLV
jgi:hypothetical protein